MPDTLTFNESPAHPPLSTPKLRCSKTARKAAKPEAAARPDGPVHASIAALAAAETARVLPSFIFGEADQIEIGARRARVSFDLVWGVVDELDVIAEDAKKASGNSRLHGLSSQLYLLLGIVSDEIDAAHGRAEKIADAARELKHPVPRQSLGSDGGLIALRLQLQAAEDALNKGDETAPIVDAYHAANGRFLEAAVRTPADMLLKLERLAEIGEMEKEPELATNQIVLNLIRDLRAGLGVNGAAS